MTEFIIEIITIIFPILAVTITGIFSAYKYFDNKKRELNQKEFENFHRLIKELVEPEEGNKEMYLDRQIAIIFELRNFKRYHECSLRILEGLVKDNEWKKKEELIKEIKLTISFIKKIDINSTTSPIMR